MRATKVNVGLAESNGRLLLGIWRDSLHVTCGLACTPGSAPGPTLGNENGKLYLYLFTRVSRYQKGKPIWILLKQQTLSGSGISWAVCKFAPRSRQITTPAPHHSFFTGRMPFLPPNQQRQSTEGNLAEKYSNNYRDKEILEHYRPRINLVSLRRVM